MARKRHEPARSGRSILLIDDSDEYRQSARRLIERDGHEVVTASGGEAGLAILRERAVDLVLVDYLMPGMTGEEFVRELRAFRPDQQVILQTGYASEHPPRELLRRLDIQGFHDKSDGPEKLVLWVDVGLAAARSLELLLASRQGLRRVLDATPSLHRIQPLEDLLQGILAQTAALIGAPEGARDGFVALRRDDGELSVHAATGRFASSAARLPDLLGDDRWSALLRALDRPHDAGGAVCRFDDATLAPLRVGARALGLVYVDRAVTQPWESELIELFANQAAVAIQNVSLYEMASLDALTGVSTRRFFDQALARELRGASRTGAPVGLLVVDVDRMKSLNDDLGHAAGDAALAALGKLLRHAVRATDFVGRIGGDEFAVLLPATDGPGVALVAERVRRGLESLTGELEGRSFQVRASVGASLVAEGPPIGAELAKGDVHASLERVARHLFRAADGAMYGDKRDRAAPGLVATIEWAAALAGTAPPLDAPPSSSARGRAAGGHPPRR